MSQNTAPPRPSATAQNYLKAIFVLGADGRPVTTSVLAQRLGVSAPTVTSMLKRLAAEGLVSHVRYHGVQLTDAGEAHALRVVRRHRLLETYLHDVLGMSWDQVHDEAEVLEHAVSDRLEDRIAAALGEPARDPHGDPIPPRRGVHREVVDEPLDRVPPGTRVRVERVSDRDPALLRYLARLEVRPGTELTVVERSPFGGPTWVQVGRRRHPLGTELARAIAVTVLP